MSNTEPNYKKGKEQKQQQNSRNEQFPKWKTKFFLEVTYAPNKREEKELFPMRKIYYVLLSFYLQIKHNQSDLNIGCVYLKAVTHKSYRNPTSYSVLLSQATGTHLKRKSNGDKNQYLQIILDVINLLQKKSITTRVRQPVKVTLTNFHHRVYIVFQQNALKNIRTLLQNI